MIKQPHVRRSPSCRCKASVLAMAGASLASYTAATLALFAATLLVGFTATQAGAVEFISPNGFYDDPTAWVGGSVPNSSQAAEFLTTGVANWGTGTGNTTSSDLFVRNGLYDFNATQGRILPEHSVTGTTLIESDGRLRLAGFGTPAEAMLLRTGTLTIRDGGELESLVGSLLVANNLVTIGDFGDSASISIRNTDSRLETASGVRIGRNGSEGTLNLTNLGRADLGGVLDLANSSAINSSGTLNITSGGSLFTTSDINVGVGTQPGQSATVDVRGTFNAANPSRIRQTGVSGIVVGASSNSLATLNVEFGGEVTAGSNGLVVNNTGTVNVNTGNLSVGIMPPSTGLNTVSLDINGGMVNSANTIIRDDGTLNLNGGTLTTGAFDNTNGGTFNHTDGELVVDGGALGVSDTVFRVESTGSPILTLRGSTSSSTLPNQLVVGSQAGATLNIEDGATFHVPETIFLAHAPGNGAANVTGMGSILSAGGDLRIGQIETSTLTVGAGASATAASNILLGRSVGSKGTAIVEGNLQAGGNIEVGFEGEGVLEVRGNGGVTAGARILLGNQAGSNGFVMVADAGATLEADQLNVGEFGSGTFTVENGASGVIGTDWITVGSWAGSDGSLVVKNAGSELTVNSRLDVGRLGMGTVRVENGGVLNNLQARIGSLAGGDGSVTVTGNDSQWGSLSLDVGVAGTGLVNVESGGSATVDGMTNVGATGTLRIDGGTLTTGSFNLDPGGTLQTARGQLVVDGGTFGLQVPHQEFNPDTTTGDFELVLKDGAVATTGTVRIRRTTITVDGAGSRWNSSSTFGVGRQGNVGEDFAGKLNILDGGVVQGTNALIANEAGSRGSVVIDGSDSEWISTGSIFLIANLGGSIANLDITNGGKLSSNANVQVARESGSTAEIRIVGQDSLWDNSGDILLGINGQATLAVEDNGSVDATGAITVGAGSRLEGNGVIDAGGGVVVNGVVDPGVIEPGGATITGALTINGDYQMASGAILDIELAGDSPGEHDQLLVSGTATLDGTLGALVFNDFVPSVGDAFVVVMADQINGQFSTIAAVPTPTGLVDYRVAYSTTTATLVVAPQLDGDFNTDGVVDAADYTVWRDSLGSTTDLAADANLDLVVSAADYAIWRANYGDTLAAEVSQATLVPEPTSAMLVAITLFVGFARRRKN